MFVIQMNPKQTKMPYKSLNLKFLVSMAFSISLICFELATAGEPGEETTALDQMVQSEAERLIHLNLNEEKDQFDHETEDEQLVEQLDTFASSISHTLSAGKNAHILQDQLSKAINIADMINKAKVKEDRRESFQSRGISDALEVSKANVLHNHRLSEKAVKELVEFAESQPKERDKVILLQLFASSELTEASGNSEHLDWQKIFHDVRRFVESTVHIAVDLSDELYMSPAFLEHLPIIGTGITRLKIAGQTTYDIIKTIRAFKKFLDHYNQLPARNGPISKLKHFLTTEKGLKMFNKDGMDSLNRLVEKLMNRFDHQRKIFNNNDKKEILDRSAHFILITACQAIANVN